VCSLAVGDTMKNHGQNEAAQQQFSRQGIMGMAGQYVIWDL